MKKTLLMTALLSSAGLYAMQGAQDALIYVKRIGASLQQIQGEARRGGPNFESLKDHTIGMITIKNQIDRDIPINEQTAVNKKWQTTLQYLASRFSEPTVQNSQAVTDWLINQLNEIDNNADSYESADRQGKASILNTYKVLNLISKKVLPALTPAFNSKRDKINNLLASIDRQVIGEIVQAYN